MHNNQSVGVRSFGAMCDADDRLSRASSISPLRTVDDVEM